MKQITDLQDKKTFGLILAFARSGGDPSVIKRMVEFCERYEIDLDKLKETVDNDDDLMNKLKRAGFI